MAAATKRKKGRNKSWLKYTLLIVGGTLLIALYFVFGPNTGTFSEGEYLYIHTGSGYEEVKQALKEGGFVANMASFQLIAKEAGYPSRVHPGKYHLHRGMSNYNIVRMLRAGRQTPVKIVITKLRTKNDFIHLIGKSLEADSDVLRQMMDDTTYLAQFGLDTNTSMCAVMPNTYEFYWNTTADKVFRKIEKKYAQFWNEDRIAAAKAHDLTPQEAIILASIVDEESNKNDEKPTIASVYLNRRKKGIRLQADPTAKFAYGDFSIKRITSVQTSVASPYNTYKVYGLPIGPICTPSPASIDAVLKSPATTYLYFCAKEDGSGYHRFASTFEEHLKNASLYHNRLDEAGIH